MSGAKSQLMPLQVRKQLLLAESEVNRVSLLHEWQSLRNETQALAQQAQSVCATVSSVASMGIAGFKAFRDLQAKRRNGKTSWLSTLINGARLGASLWTSLRSGSRL